MDVPKITLVLAEHTANETLKQPSLPVKFSSDPADRVTVHSLIELRLPSRARWRCVSSGSWTFGGRRQL